MPPSDPACPTCGTQVRANDYWSYLAGPSSPRVYYPKSIMDDNPEIAGTFTRCADPFHAAPSDPAAVPPPKWTEDVLIALAWAEGDERNRIIASVREGAINTAADVAYEIAEENPSQVRRAILSLLHTPPSGGAG